MNLPQVYMCSPSWILLPPPSPYHLSGSSQCTSPNHPLSCIEPGLALIGIIQHIPFFFFLLQKTQPYILFLVSPSLETWEVLGSQRKRRVVREGRWSSPYGEPWSQRLASKQKNSLVSNAFPGRHSVVPVSVTDRVSINGPFTQPQDVLRAFMAVGSHYEPRGRKDSQLTLSAQVSL